MVEDKVGQKEYLGIKIDYSKENKLNKFSLDTLKDRYLYEASGETHAQEAFARASVFSATFKGVTDFELAQRLYNYSSDLWFMFSTPILSNGEQIGVYLLAAFSITYLTVVTGYLLTMMKTYGSLVQVEVLVDIGEILEVMASLLLTIVVLLVQYHL